MIYKITSKQGSCYGTFSGDTEGEALIKLHRSAGYDSSDVWERGGKLFFRDESTKVLLGDVEDWVFVKQDRCLHEADPESVVCADVLVNGIVLDFTCKRCGKSGSLFVDPKGIEFDE